MVAETDDNPKCDIEGHFSQIIFFFFVKLNCERSKQSLQLDYLAKVAKYP